MHPSIHPNECDCCLIALLAVHFRPLALLCLFCFAFSFTIVCIHWNNRGCCAALCAKLLCCRKKPSLESRRTSMNSKKQSIAPTLPPEDTRPKLDESLIDHTSVMKAAIPVLPIGLAWFCLICNCLVPGTGKCRPIFNAVVSSSTTAEYLMLLINSIFSFFLFFSSSSFRHPFLGNVLLVFGHSAIFTTRWCTAAHRFICCEHLCWPGTGIHVNLLPCRMGLVDLVGHDYASYSK